MKFCLLLLVLVPYCTTTFSRKWYCTTGMEQAMVIIRALAITFNQIIVTPTRPDPPDRCNRDIQLL
jgi:hypothetical protein